MSVTASLMSFTNHSSNGSRACCVAVLSNPDVCCIMIPVRLYLATALSNCKLCIGYVGILFPWFDLGSIEEYIRQASATHEIGCQNTDLVLSEVWPYVFN